MLNEIGRCFNIGASGVSQASRRIAIKMDKDSGLREKICRIENSLKLSRMKRLLINVVTVNRMTKQSQKTLTIKGLPRTFRCSQ